MDARDGSDTGVTRLRAWSRLTGWRFESSSAHRESPAQSAIPPFRILQEAGWDGNLGWWQRSWQHRAPQAAGGRARATLLLPSTEGERRMHRRDVAVCTAATLPAQSEGGSSDSSGAVASRA